MTTTIKSGSVFSECWLTAAVKAFAIFKHSKRQNPETQHAVPYL